MTGYARLALKIPALLISVLCLSRTSATLAQCELHEEAKLIASDPEANKRLGHSVSVNGDVAIVGADDDDYCRENYACGSAYVYRLKGSTWVQEQKLTASDASYVDSFGLSVSISGDVAVVGAPYKSCAGANCGAVYVYRFNGSTWVEEQKLTASDASTGDVFGFSVSVSAHVAIVGAPNDDCGGGVDCGSAYIYRFNGSTWIEEQKLTASDVGGSDRFGWSVSVDGSIVVVGARWDDCAAGTDCGSAYIYLFNGNTWIGEQKLTASDAAQDTWFGWSVSVSDEVVVVGAPRNDCAAGAHCGSAYVYRFNGSAWVEEQKLAASDAAPGDRFGTSVSVSGNAAVVGAYSDDCAAGIYCGSAYIYRFNGSNWVQEQKLTASDAAQEDGFGVSVFVSGNVAVVGAHHHDCAAGINCGSAYVYRFNGPGGPGWVEEAKLTASDAAVQDDFGISVSVSGDVAVVGAYQDDCAAGLLCGSAYVYRFNGSIWIQEQKLIASDAAPDDQFGISVSVSGNVSVVGAYSDDCAGGIGCGSAYVYRFNGSTWVQQTKLTASDEAVQDYFGISVSVSGDMAIVGALYDDCAAGADCGSAFVYAIAPDCNGNGLADFCDIRDGVSPDSNTDGIPDDCQCVPPTPILANTEAYYCEDTGVPCIGAVPNSCTSNGPCLPSFCVTHNDCNPFGSADGRCLGGRCHTPYNRYITFYPPPVPTQATGVGLRVTFLAMPGPSNCPQMPDYSAFQDDVMWVGAPNPATGVSRLVSAPVYRVWGTELVVVSDCNIVPCSQYLIDVISSFAGCPPACPACFSPGTILTTASRWGDVMGEIKLSPPSNSIPGFHDVGALVDRFQNLPFVPPNEKPRCDLCRNVPSQGGGPDNVDFVDIGCVVDAFKGLSYDSSVKNAQGQHGPAGSGGTCAVP